MRGDLGFWGLETCQGARRVRVTWTWWPRRSRRGQGDLDVVAQEVQEGSRWPGHGGPGGPRGVQVAWMWWPGHGGPGVQGGLDMVAQEVQEGSRWPGHGGLDMVAQEVQEGSRWPGRGGLDVVAQGSKVAWTWWPRRSRRAPGGLDMVAQEGWQGGDTVVAVPRYLYGKRLEGTAFVLFGVMVDDEKKSIPQSLQRVPVQDGDAEAVLSMAHLRERFPNPQELVGHSLYVTVTVITESGSDMVEAQHGGIRIVTSPYSIHFTRTPKYFKPGMPFDLTVYVTNPDQSPAPRVTVQADGFQGQVSTQRDGTARLVLNMPANKDSVPITVRTAQAGLPPQRQASRQMTALAYRSQAGSGNFLHLAVAGTELQPGDNLAVNFHLKTNDNNVRNSVPFFTFLVMSKGRILRAGRQRHEAGQSLVTMTLPVTPELIPSFRVVAYYHVLPGEIVADSVWVDVKDTCMGTLVVKGATEGDNRVHEPGTPMRLRIEGDHKAHVGLVAVDKGVFVLSKKNKLTQTRVGGPCPMSQLILLPVVPEGHQCVQCPKGHQSVPHPKVPTRVSHSPKGHQCPTPRGPHSQGPPECPTHPRATRVSYTPEVPTPKGHQSVPHPEVPTSVPQPQEPPACPTAPRATSVPQPQGPPVSHSPKGHQCPTARGPHPREPAGPLPAVSRCPAAAEYSGKLERKCCEDGMKENPMGHGCERRSQYIQEGESCVRAFLDCCAFIQAKRDQQNVALGTGLARSQEEDDLFSPDSDIVSRTLFPESWLWQVEQLTEPPNDLGVSAKTLPVYLKDSITTWEVLAVSLSPSKGTWRTRGLLGNAPKPWGGPVPRLSLRAVRDGCLERAAGRCENPNSEVFLLVFIPQGGYQGAEPEVSLTAFVLIALKEARDTCKDHVNNLDDSINKAANFLARRYEQLARPYTVALASYALALAGKLKSEKVLMKFSKGGASWEERNARTYNIEGTSYALLALVEMRKSELAGPVVRWLAQQNYYGGGYGSTQATILVFQALAQYQVATEAQQQLEMDVSVLLPRRANPVKYRIENRNALVARSTETKLNEEFTVKAEGVGKGTMTVVTVYHAKVPEKDNKCDSFDLSVDVEDVDTGKEEEEIIRSVKISICTRYLDTVDATMSILDVSMLTGFSPDVQDLRVVIYLDKVSHKAQECFAFKAHQRFQVGLIQPAAVSVYSYYRIDDRCTRFYHPDKEGGKLSKICQGEVCRCAEGDTGDTQG
ncbi:complement C3-like, partial [Parus major]|uniref:complement C3-like n=1 Tax=Parus major TaxID=9157 RepID=UPI00144477E8